MGSEIWDLLKYRQLFPGLEWLFSAIDSKDLEVLKKRINEIRAAGKREADFLNENWKPSHDFPQYIPIATLSFRSGIQESMFGYQMIAKAFCSDAEKARPSVFHLPYALDIDKNTNILVEGASEKTEICQRFLRDIIWGFLVFVPATKLNISVFDCETMGSSINALFDLKKQNPDLFDRDICTSKEEVYEELSRLNMQITDCIQNKLGSRYRTLMEYNRKNPAGSEPIRLLTITDFPRGFDSRNVELLQNILKNGGKCGIYVLLHYNRDIPFSRYDNMENTVEDLKKYVCAFDEKIFPKPRIDALCDGKLAFPDRGAEWFATAYAKESEKIRKQGILFDNILDQELFGRNASSSLEIPIGIGDGGGTASISFGKGSSHHALIAGATGSGKSQLLHTMIISAMMHYSPDEVNLYLMDFKNGTEFKIYDSYRLPHIRLLAIDAMQEFGESILEELLNEVNRRSEQFKRAGVSKVADYVDTTGKPMPRILVIMDEFQQLFNSSTNRTIAGHCAELVKRIVTEGRSYGIHLLMATQSTKIVSSLSIDMGTIEQMRIRIGLKCNEDDARFLFKDNDSKAVGMMKGPIGTAVINQEYTESETRKFRAAYCGPDERGKYLEAIAQKFADAPCEKRTFEGSRTTDLLEVLRTEKGGQPEDPVTSVEVGECIKVAPPLSIRFGKQKIHNILICGADEKIAGNIFYLMNWSILRNPFSRFYCIDGNLLVDEMGSMPYYEIFQQYGERFKLAESRGDIIRFIHEIYDIYKEKKKHNTKEAIFVGIRNFQFLDIVKQMMKGDMIDEREYLDEEASFDAGDPFAAESEFDFGVGLGAASSSDPTGVSERMIKLITDGTAYGIHFILTCMEYQSIRENMYYGENVLSKFPEKFVFSLNDADADALIPGVSVAALAGNTVYYTDSVKDTCQVKPYVFPETEDLAWFVNAEPAQKAYAAEEYETALRLYEGLAEKGFAKAQYNCGLMYTKGEGTSANLEKALHWYEKAAKQGHKEAQYNCGRMYANGEGTAPDQEIALYWYEKAAEQGHKDAQFFCGWMYDDGEGTLPNQETALKWYEKAAEQGQKAAQFRCGRMYSKGNGTSANPEKALHWYEKAAAQGHKDAQFECGLMYAKGEGTSANPETALHWYEKAAEQGHKDAQFRCGLMYYNGEGTAVNKERALSWWEEAAKQGHRAAQYNCGLMYAKGDGTAANKEAALMWYEKAAEQGHKEAQYNCGLMYAKGEGTSANPETALYWYEKAAAQGHKEAQHECGLLYYAKGEGASANPETALHWYEKAAAQGHKEAQFRCGWMYYNGEGTAVDKETALSWWEEAAKQGHRAAQYNCGLMYTKGEGTSANPETALHWYEKAAGQGQKDAQYFCGLMYAKGEGTPADPEKALYWYEKAAAQGHKEAQNKCGLMYYAKGEGSSTNPEAALMWYEKAAKQGHKEAQYNCGRMYANGEGTAPDQEIALYWYEKAAEQGHKDAQFFCGWMYDDGEGTLPNPEIALHWYEKAAEQGQKAAQFRCGRMYSKGNGTSANPEKALYWYEKAAAQGHKDAQFECGWMYAKGEGTSANLETALHWYEKAAQQGHKDAQYNCGLMYAKGEGTSANLETALHWYEKAAAQGHKEAQYNCGLMHAKGEGTSANLEKALHWYEKAAAQGQKDAQFRCGLMYYKGEGTAVDKETALRWWEEAAKQGNRVAQYNCGWMYAKGEGTAVDPKTALHWYEKAAAQGHKEAQYKCGWMYAKGEGTAADPKAALHWYEKAAAQGLKEGQYKCGWMYAKGEGTAADPKTALHWYEKAAAQGHKEAQYKCGWMYARGNGTSANPAKALHWYEKAAQQGHKDAQFECGKLYHHGEGIAHDMGKAMDWFQKAAQQGVVKAMYNLAVMYYNGYGISADMKTAYTWFEQAAKGGHVKSQYKCAEMLFNGEAPKDMEKARKWFLCVASQDKDPELKMKAKANLVRF